MTTDLHDPGRYLHGGELVLTGMLWRTGPADSERFVRTIVAGGAVALAAGEAEVGPVPEDLVDACRRHRMPSWRYPTTSLSGPSPSSSAGRSRPTAPPTWPPWSTATACWSPRPAAAGWTPSSTCSAATSTSTAGCSRPPAR
ncbi:PucR family transcriptional regulator ligand-binding domain-containing protein [Kitasatospora aburaviensis]